MNDKATRDSNPAPALQSAVAELVIDLTIALKNASTYGEGHPSAVKSIEALANKLGDVFRNREELKLQFTGTFIIFEDSHLDRANPIYRQSSELFSSLGIAALTFYPGTTTQESAAFISSVITARRRRASPAEARALLDGTGLKHIEVGFLRDMLKFEERELVKIKGGNQAESLWDNYLVGLEQPGGPQPLIRAARVSTPKQSNREPDQAAKRKSKIKGPRELESETETDKAQYATAIVDYLRTLEGSEEGLGALGQAPLSAKIHTFVDSLNDDLRKQLLASTFASDELAPETVRVFAETLGEKRALEALQQLNDENRKIPTSLFRALSLLSFLQPAALATKSTNTSTETDNAQPKLLERLLAEGQQPSYISAEYEAKMQALQEFVGTRMDSEAPTPGDQAVFSDLDIEDHFLKTISSLLAGAPDDSKLTGAVLRGAGESLHFFLDRKLSAKCHEAIDLAHRAQLEASGLRTEASIWNSSGLLDRLVREIDSSDAEVAQNALDSFAWIGEAAVPKMLEALNNTARLSTRRRILDAFLKMEPFPSEALLPGLDQNETWYLQRNTLWLLRERLDSIGVEAAMTLWPHATVKVKAEIIEYLHALKHPKFTSFVKLALYDRSRWLALKVARNLSRWDSPSSTEELVRKIHGLPRWQLGSNFHVSLLNCLAQSGDPRVPSYLDFVRTSSRPLFSLQKQRLLKETDRLLSSLKVVNE